MDRIVGSICAAWLLLLMGFAGLGGCVETRVVKDGWDSWKPNHRPGAAGGSKSTQDKKGPSDNRDIGAKGQWTITLGAVTGPDHAERAARIQQELSDGLGLTALWVSQQEAATTLNHGHYEGPNHPQAQEDLFKLRQLQNDGVLKVSVLMLVPASLESKGSLADYDLLNVQKKGHYTLMLGYYDQDYGSDYRKAAEQAAAALRVDGYEAYFYHGPNLSQVTIGVFGPEVVQQVKRGNQITFEIVDEKVLALQQLFPKYLANGLEQTTRTTDRNGKTYEDTIKTQLGAVP